MCSVYDWLELAFNLPEDDRESSTGDTYREFMRSITVSDRIASWVLHWWSEINVSVSCCASRVFVVDVSTLVSRRMFTRPNLLILTWPSALTCTNDSLYVKLLRAWAWIWTKGSWYNIVWWFLQEDICSEDILPERTWGWGRNVLWSKSLSLKLVLSLFFSQRTRSLILFTVVQTTKLKLKLAEHSRASTWKKTERLNGLNAFWKCRASKESAVSL